ncbi:hypothetical protein SEA_YAKULT_39 [Gordonia phage Yakult]|nr:hypothetical protein SEA_YAKULT_39 [Gordonia phage Yakult]
MTALIAVAFIVFLNVIAGLAYWSVWHPDSAAARIIAWLERD